MPHVHLPSDTGVPWSGPGYDFSLPSDCKYEVHLVAYKYQIAPVLAVSVLGPSGTKCKTLEAWRDNAK